MDVYLRNALRAFFRLVSLTASSRAFSFVFATVFCATTWLWLGITPRLSALPLFMSLTLSFSLTLHGMASVCMSLASPTVCNVRLQINQELTLVYRSWWPRGLCPSDVRRLAEEAAIRSAQSWYETTEGSHPRLLLSADDARALISAYISVEEPCSANGQCCICLDQLDSAPSTLKVCSHRYHRDCIATWFTKGRLSCPYCRSDHSVCVPVEVRERHLAKREASISLVSTEVRQDSEN